MKKISSILVLLFFLIGSVVYAQQRTIKGKITSPDGESLPGATVTIKGKTKGVTSDMDGKFEISVGAEDEALKVSFLGFKSMEMPIGASNTINVTLTEDSELLNEVVITAMGISREKKSLGYATQTVEGETVARAKNVNFMSALSGQVAGAQIKNSGTMGGSANVIIRGYKSIGANNQPLYIVDGIPISNAISNSANQRTGRGGFDYGNAAMDINPDDIASIEVLKGAAATALYGSRASNGVVIIVTKKGTSKKKSVGVTVSTGIVAGQINKNTMPKYQTEYGAGYGPYYGANILDVYSADNYLYSIDSDGDGTADAEAYPMEEDASYGAAFADRDKLLNWQSIYPELEDTYLKEQPYQAAENNPTTFYETSMRYTNSIAVEGGNESGNYRLSLTDMQHKGIAPNSKLHRNNASLNINYKLSDKLNVGSSMKFIQTKGLGRFGTGYDSRNVNQSFRQWYQVSADMMDLKDAYDKTGLNLTWNPYGFSDPSVTHRTQPHYFDNPYFMRNESYNNDQRNRLIGNAFLEYKFNDVFKLKGQVTNDSYDEIREERIAVGSVDVPSYYKYSRSYTERNYNLMLNINKDINEKLNFTGLIGTNLRRQNSLETEGMTNGGLIVPGLYALSNGVNGMIAPTFLPSTNDYKILSQPYEAQWERAVDGYFASASFGYDRFLYLDLTARRDVSSTLPLKDENGDPGNVYYYPAASLALVYSELIDAPILDFGKLRLNYAKVGNDAPVQSITNDYLLNTSFNGTSLATAKGTNRNPYLKPEITNSMELGFENKFFENKLGLDLTFYQSNTSNQILNARVSSAAGAIRQYINAGNIQNRGVELSLYGTPYQTDNFEWTTRINWSKNVSQVTELKEGLDAYQLTSMQGGVSVEAVVGEPYGSIVGTDFVMDGNEKVVIPYPSAWRSGVLYAKTASTTTIGNMQPDWVGSWSNGFKYKNLSLNALIDVQKGGDFFSLDTWYGFGTGLYDVTAGTNDAGKPVRDRPEDGGGIDIGGVLAEVDATTGAVVVDEDGNAVSSGVANTTNAWMSDYRNAYGWATAPNAMHVYDASYVKLRQLSITYSIPSSKLEKLPFSRIDVALMSNNLAILFKNSPYSDPESGLSAGNIQGYQSGAYPTTREYGFNVTLKF